MTYPIRQPPDGDTAWGSDVRATIAGVNDHQTRLTTLEQLPNAKGDLMAATAADAWARLPVGANGQVLKADSTAATGLVWGTDISGGGGGSTTLVHAVGNSGSALTLDAASASGWVKTITLTANCTFTLSGAVTGQLTQLELVLTQDATGGRTVTWPASVKWSGGAPTLTSTANAVDRIVLSSYNGGTTWYGDLIGKAYA